MAQRLTRVRLVVIRSACTPQTLQAFAESCLRFSPRIALRTHSPSAVFIDLTGIPPQVEGPRSKERVLALARRLGLEVWIEDAESAGIALARFQERPQSALLFKDPVRNEETLVAWGRFPIRSLEWMARPFEFNEDWHKRVLSWEQKLKPLGIRTLHAFLGLPARSLASRLGEQAVELHQRLSARLSGEVLGLGSEPKTADLWPRFEPEAVLEFKSDLEDEVLLEPVLFALKQGLELCVPRLYARGLKVSALELELDSLKIRVEFSFPEGSVRGLMDVLRERLSREWQRRMLSRPLRSLRLRVSETVPSDRAQRDFFRVREERDEMLMTLLNRIQTRDSESRAFKAEMTERYLPEFSWQKVSPLKSAGPGGESSCESGKARWALLPRPSRFLSTPIEASMSDFIRREGPERISNEWWTDRFLRAQDRDYFIAENRQGVLMWVYRERGLATSGRVWIQGIFD